RFFVTPAHGRCIGGNPRPVEIGMNKRADLRLPDGERIKAALEVGARCVMSAGELDGAGKKRLRLRHGRDIGGQHRQASVRVMAATRRWLAIMEVRSRNWRARAGSDAISRSSSKLRRRISGSLASRRFLFAIDCSCTNSVATVRRCKL